jgi:tRNA dimethylallyltransferase
MFAIVGQTASGKTDLAIKLARKFGGEIICADSRTVYRDMNIGTAKPSSVEQKNVPHWGLDLVNPGEQWTLFNFQQYAKQKIEEIRVRGKIPFLVGGSGLYVDSILFDYDLGKQSDQELRDELNKMDETDLIKLLKKRRIELPNNFHNKQYLIRAVEQNGINRRRRITIIKNAYVVGISTTKSELDERILRRAKQMVDGSLINETKNLFKKYGDLEIFHRNAYGEAKKYLDGEIKTKAELIEKIALADRHLAKKQMTWFKRNKQIVWLTADEIENYSGNILARQCGNMC